MRKLTWAFVTWLASAACSSPAPAGKSTGTDATPHAQDSGNVAECLDPHDDGIPCKGSVGPCSSECIGGVQTEDAATCSAGQSCLDTCIGGWRHVDVCPAGKWEHAEVIPCGDRPAEAPRCLNLFGPQYPDNQHPLRPCCPGPAGPDSTSPYPTDVHADGGGFGVQFCADKPLGYPGYDCTEYPTPPMNGSYCSCYCGEFPPTGVVEWLCPC